jgi:hypothetical protein
MNPPVPMRSNVLIIINFLTTKLPALTAGIQGYKVYTK